MPSVSQLSWVAGSARPVITPDGLTPVMVTSCVSLRSTSVNVIVPDAVSGVAEPTVSGASVIAPVCALLVMTDVSLLPVTVIVTGSVDATLCSSVTDIS